MDPPSGTIPAGRFECWNTDFTEKTDPTDFFSEELHANNQWNQFFQ